MKIPEPQGHLTKEAKIIYFEICSLLDAVDALEDVDSYGLSMMADCLYQFRQATKVVNKDGPITRFDTGHTQVSAWFTVKKDSYATFLKFCAEYGLSPRARQLILKFKAKKKETDAMDDL